MISDYPYERFEYEGKKLIRISGIDWGYSNVRGIEIISETSHYILCRVKGQGYRAALAQFGYDPPEYIIFKKTTVNGKEVIANPLGDWELEYDRKTMVEAKRKALEELKRLEGDA